MMRQHLNAIRQFSQMASQGSAAPKMGIVSSYDPGNYSAKVLLQPENKETGWLPVGVEWAGNGWGMFCPPTPGNMAEVQFQEDGQSAGYISKVFYNNDERPLQVPSGEFWLVHQSSSCFKFHNDGTVELVTASDLNTTVGGNMNTTVAGNMNLSVAGSIASSAAAWSHAGDFSVIGIIRATLDVLAAAISLFNHKHGGVIRGGAPTDGPQ